MPNNEIAISAAVLIVAVLFALFYRPRRAGTSTLAQPAQPTQVAQPMSAPAPASGPAQPAQSPPMPTNPIQAFTQMGEGHMNAEFARALGMFQAQKVASELSEALAIIARPITPPKA